MSEKVQFPTNVPIDVALKSTMPGQTDSEGLSGSSLNPALWTEPVSQLHRCFNLKAEFGIARKSAAVVRTLKRLNGRRFAPRHCLSEEKTDMACPDCSSSAGDFRIVTSVETHGLDCGP